MKKLLSLILALTILSSCLALVGCNMFLNSCYTGNHSIDQWVDDGEYVSIHCSECDKLIHRGKPNYDLHFTINQDNSGYIVIAAGKAAENETIIIPQTYNGLPVTEVRGLEPLSSFNNGTITYEESHIKTLYISPSVESVGGLYGCDKLENVYISKSVTEMPDYIFSNCDSLRGIYVSVSNPNYKSIGGHFYTKDGTTLIRYAPQNSRESFVLPKGVSVISEDAFAKASNLEHVVLPDTLEIIESSAFKDCSSLLTINIPDNVTSVGAGAFYNCKALECVEIGAGVENIGRLAFFGCSKLEKFIVDIENPYFSAIDGHLYNKDETTLLQYAIGNRSKKFTGNSNIVTIGEFAFHGASYLKEVILPPSLTEIKNGAFNNCSSLDVISLPTSLTKIGEHAFGGDTDIKEVHIKELSTIYKIKFEGLYSSPFCNSADLYISNSLMEEINIPEYFYEVPQSAFMGCGSIKSVVIGSRTTSIGKSSFFGCKSLERVVIQNGVYSIKGSAFYGCTSLKELVISDSVTYIDGNAFSDCTSLESVVLPKNIRQINNSTFANCTSLKSITISNTVTEIGFNAFMKCTALEEIHFNGTVEEWTAIDKSNWYNNGCKTFTVYCINGVITVPEWQ